MKIKNMKNMKKYILILSIIGGGLLAASCADWLDLRPHNALDTESAISTVEDGQTALYGAYDNLRPYYFYGRNIFVCGDAGGEDLVLRTDNSNRYVNQYRWNIQSGDGPGVEMWAYAYYTIKRVNEIIAILPTKAEQSATRDQVLGESYFIRALCHYELVKFFGQAYNHSEKMGVPYIKESTMNNDNPRETVESNFTNIIADLEMALDLMNVAKKADPSTVGSDAVKALLARVYLYMACTNGTTYFNEAAKYAEQVIEANNYKLATPAQYKIEVSGATLVSQMWGNQNNPESIFTLPTTNSERLGVNSMGNIYLDKGKGYGDLMATEAMVAIFEPNDVRHSMIYLVDDGFEHYAVGKHMGNGIAGGWDLSFINVLRLSEMYLISAEAHARTGNQPIALKRINELRAQRGVADLGATNLIDNIILERRRELCFEGHSLSDHKRLNSSIVRNADEGNPEHGNLGLAYPDYRFAYPIPEREISINRHPDFKQNPGYGQ